MVLQKNFVWDTLMAPWAGNQAINLCAYKKVSQFLKALHQRQFSLVHVPCLCVSAQNTKGWSYLTVS